MEGAVAARHVLDAVGIHRLDQQRRTDRARRAAGAVAPPAVRLHRHLKHAAPRLARRAEQATAARREARARRLVRASAEVERPVGHRIARAELHQHVRLGRRRRDHRRPLAAPAHERRRQTEVGARARRRRHARRAHARDEPVLQRHRVQQVQRVVGVALDRAVAHVVQIRVGLLLLPRAVARERVHRRRALHKRRALRLQPLQLQHVVDRELAVTAEVAVDATTTRHAASVRARLRQTTDAADALLTRTLATRSRLARRQKPQLPPKSTVAPGSRERRVARARHECRVECARRDTSIVIDAHVGDGPCQQEHARPNHRQVDRPDRNHAGQRRRSVARRQHHDRRRIVELLDHTGEHASVRVARRRARAHDRRLARRERRERAQLELERLERRARRRADTHAHCQRQPRLHKLRARLGAQVDVALRRVQIREDLLRVRRARSARHRRAHVDRRKPIVPKSQNAVG